MRKLRFIRIEFEARNPHSADSVETREQLLVDAVKVIGDHGVSNHKALAAELVILEPSDIYAPQIIIGPFESNRIVPMHVKIPRIEVSGEHDDFIH